MVSRAQAQHLTYNQAVVENLGLSGDQACRAFQITFLGILLISCSEWVMECRAADWPRLGGLADGVSLEHGLAHSWPSEGPPVLWTNDVGEGFAGAAVWGREVFLLDRIPNRQDVLRCLELETGREIWKLAYEAPGTLPFNGSRNVPTVDDCCVFSLGPFGHLQAVDRRTHSVLWSKHLIDDFKDSSDETQSSDGSREAQLARVQVPMWGLTQAPLIYQDLVIVGPQTRSTGLVAYEKGSGKIRWRSEYIGRNWYSHVSPYLATLCEVDQVIMLAQPSDPEKAPADAPPALITSLDPLTGQILWKTNTPAPDKIPIPSPLRIGDDRLFISGGYKFGCLMLQLGFKNSVWTTKLVFHNRTVCPHIHSPIYYRDKLYLTSFREQGATHTGLVCMNPDGEVVWETGPALEFDGGAYLIADGMIFIMQGKTGELFLFELSPKSPKLLARAKVLEAKGGNVWAPMALAAGKLIVRDQHQIKCLDARDHGG
jgi:outer membrane protein assembly factor BamB